MLFTLIAVTVLAPKWGPHRHMNPQTLALARLSSLVGALLAGCCQHACHVLASTQAAFGRPPTETVSYAFAQGCWLLDLPPQHQRHRQRPHQRPILPASLLFA